MQGEFDLMTSDYASHPQHFNHMVEAFRRDLKQFHSQLNNITAAPWFCGDTTWYWKENFPHAYEAIYGNYQNNVLANIIFVDFQQQGERGLTNAPDEDPDDLSTGYFGSAYRSAENWTTSLRSSHFSAAARRGIISDRFVEAILQFGAKGERGVYSWGMSLSIPRADNKTNEIKVISLHLRARTAGNCQYNNLAQG